MAKFRMLLKTNTARLENASIDEKKRRLYQRVVWYYTGLVNENYDWSAMRAVYDLHERLDMVPTDYKYASLYKCCCVPGFEWKLNRMLGLDQN